MKRFAFWLVAAIIAISWVSSNHRHRRPGPPPPEPVHRKMIVRTLASTDGSGRGQKVYVLESDDERIVSIDEKGVVHITKQSTRDTRDEDDEDRLAPADGLPVSIVPGSRVTEARIEAPRAPEPPKPPKPPKAPRIKHQPPKPIVPPTPLTKEVEAKPLVVAGRLSATEERAVNDAACRSLLLMLGLSLATAGCGPGQGSLTGKVSYQHKSVCSGSVLVVGGDGLISDSPIDADGVYAVKNVVAGTVKIIVNSRQPGTAKNLSTRPDKKVAMPVAPIDPGWFPIPEHYADFDKSGLTFQLKPGANVWNIELK